MDPLSFPHADAVELLVAQLDSFAAHARRYDEVELLDPSRCRGWSRLDLIVHVRAGLEEMVRGTTALVEEPADTDAASYWRAYPGAGDAESDPVDGILWLRRTASAYRRPESALRHLDDVVEGTRVAVRALGEGVVSFQGCRMATGDFLGTWVVELAVHQLDLDDAAGDPAAGAGSIPPGLGWTRRTLEALAGTPLPGTLDDRTAVLAALGRTGPAAGSMAELPAAYPVAL